MPTNPPLPDNDPAVVFLNPEQPHPHNAIDVLAHLLMPVRPGCCYQHDLQAEREHYRVCKNLLLEWFRHHTSTTSALAQGAK